uniref:Uncharacterized protein n=1 Tax=Spongospora subterranea TaxID=70186 RepID=A0A0H5R7B8_9EUKA|eukprot:CRZ10003.1 hypothetical protein [Spongospora subterranea]
MNGKGRSWTTFRRLKSVVTLTGSLKPRSSGAKGGVVTSDDIGRVISVRPVCHGNQRAERNSSTLDQWALALSGTRREVQTGCGTPNHFFSPSTGYLPLNRLDIYCRMLLSLSTNCL